MSSRLWSPAVMKPFEWSVSLFPSGEVNTLVVVSVAGMFLFGGGDGPCLGFLLSHPALGPAMAVGVINFRCCV